MIMSCTGQDNNKYCLHIRHVKFGILQVHENCDEAEDDDEEMERYSSIFCNYEDHIQVVTVVTTSRGTYYKRIMLKFTQNFGCRHLAEAR